MVSEAFYPFTGFTSATSDGERTLGYATRPFGKSALDCALDTAAESGWALYELPHRHALRTDREAVTACAALAARVLRRGAVACSQAAPAGAVVGGPRIAVGTAHRDQAAAARAALARHRVPAP